MIGIYGTHPSGHTQSYTTSCAIGADFKAVKYTGADVTDKTINRGLTLIVDLDNVANTGVGAGQVPGWQQNAVAKLTQAT